MVDDPLPREADEVERELATLAAHLDAATHRMLLLVRRFDELGGWAATGARSCAHWLSWRVGLAPGAARERVRVAHALGALPRMDEAMRTGRLSYSKVRAMTRVATPDNEEALVEMAHYATAAQIEKICRGVSQVNAQDGSAPHGQRAITVRQLDSGLVRIMADLHADEAALVMAAIETARGVSAGTSVPSRADGLVRVAEAFLAGGADAARPTAERKQVVVELRPSVLEEGYRAELEDGTYVPAETFRRVACDCALTAVVTGPDGDVTASGRRSRVVAAPLRRALRLRDPCCRFPGCTNRLWLDAHHIQHWAHGGPTTLENVLHLCPSHHTLVHEGGFGVTRDGDDIVFRTPDGRVIEPAPAPPPLGGDPTAELCAAQRSLDIDDETGLTHWDGRAPDYRACVAAALAPVG